MKAFLSLVACVAALGMTGICARAEGIKIVAAENFYGGVAKQIVGNDASVTSILSNPNQDPHEFTTDALTARAVADADIVIYNGIGYDSWMDKLLGTDGKPGRAVICVAGLIGAKDGDNPHIWYDPRTMPALADKLSASLAAKDASNSKAFRQRADDFKVSLQPILTRINTIRSTHEGLAVTATEPVFGYMAQALGFRMLNGGFQIKVMNDAEPSADETAAFEKSLTSHEVKMLFYNSQVTDPTTERLKKMAGKAGIPVVGVTETEPPDRKDYVDWMVTELQAVATGLAGNVH